ncbi:MAG: hypothetical protein ACOC0P_07320, partial [Planctomycetota bacterium]
GGMLAATLAIDCPLGSFTYAELTGQYDDAPVEQPEGDELILPSLPGVDDPELEEKVREGGERIIDEIDKRAQEIGDRARERGENAGDDAGAGGVDEDAPAGGDPSAGDDGDLGRSGDDAQQNRRNRIAAWRVQVRKLITGTAEVAADRWNDFPMAQKWSTIVASVGGAIGGLLLGLLLPSISAAIVTSLVGSLLWLTSGSWLLARFGVSPDSLGATSAVGVLLWWLITAGVGVLTQFKVKRRKADKK